MNGASSDITAGERSPDREAAAEPPRTGPHRTGTAAPEPPHGGTRPGATGRPPRHEEPGRSGAGQGTWEERGETKCRGGPMCTTTTKRCKRARRFLTRRRR